MDETIKEIAQAVVSIQTIIIYCLAIVLSSACVYNFGFKSKMKKILSSMKISLEKIRNLPELHNFYGSFRSFDQEMGTDDLLGHLWKEFKETLVMPSATADTMIIRNTSEASCCFNESSIIANNINLRFYNALPNYLTGSGILGTFIGLVAGIYLAGIGLASTDDFKIMMTGLNNLLHGASLAFLTSICGLGASIIFSWREKIVSHELSKLIGDWNEELDRRIERITPERLAGEQLEELKRQTGYQEEFVTKVAFNISEALGSIMEKRLVPGIADALDQRMNERLVPALDKLVVAVDKMREERGDTNESMLKQVVDQFTETMSGAAGREMTALYGTLQKLNTTLVPLVASMQKANVAMCDNATLIANGIKDSFTESNRAFNAGVEKAMVDLQAAVSVAGDSFNASLQKELVPLVGDLKKSQQDMHAKFTSLASQFEQAASNSSQAFAEGAGKAIEQLQKGIADAGSVLHGELKDAFGQAVDRLDQATKGLDDVLFGIRHAGGDIKDMVANTGVLLNRFGAAAKSFADIESRLSGSIQSLERTAQSIQAGGDAARSAMTQVQSGVSALREAVEQFQAEHETVQETLENYASHLEGLDTDLEKVFTKMQEGQLAYAEATRNYMVELDGHAAKVTEAFGGAVSELSGTLEELVESVETLVEAMNRARQGR